MRRTIALLTDFGDRDGFVGALKGVILSINPDVNLIDISHNVPSFNILDGSIVLRATYNYFPKGTIFLSVVDPGVGTERKAIIVKTESYIFVGPDNGLLSPALKKQTIEKIVSVENGRYFLKTDTNTFHGRDIFAPIVAYISLGEPLENFGPEIDRLADIGKLEAIYEEDRIVGRIIKFDKFGNAITNLETLPENFILKFRDYTIYKVCKNFREGQKDTPNLIKGSFGFYEIFIPEKSLRDFLKAVEGEMVEVYRI